MLGQPNLPLNDNNFIGREEEIKEIASHLKSQSTRIVGVHGPPGSGKSEVAIAVGHYLKRQGKAIYHIDLTDVNTEDGLISAILRYFSDHPTGILQPIDFLLKQFSLLKDSVSPYFILDNANSLLQTMESKDRFLNLINQILISCASVKMLVVTRESFYSRKLKTLGQTLVRIGPVDNVYSQKLVQDYFPEGCDKDWSKVARFCGHMPFAIRLFCNNMSRNELPLSQAIDNFISLIKSDLSNLNDRDEQEQRKLNAIVESSYKMLCPENKEFYVSLSVIPGLFNETVAAAVWGTSTHDTQRTLESLLRKSLIDSCYESRSYKVHNIFRLFAMQKGAQEMNEVVARSKTRLIQFYISRFAELNHRFLSAQSMSAFIDFYEDKHNIISSLISGCLDHSTLDSCFDALTQGMLFLDTVLWSDRVSFDKVYNTAITEAKQRKEFATYNQLILAKAFSEVTWGTEEVEIKQLYGNTNGLLPCDSDEQEGKRLCFLGIHKLANAQIDDGVKHLEDSLMHLSKINEPQLNILRIVTVQILELYYESKKCQDKAAAFFEHAKKECEFGEQQDLFIIPKITGKHVKSKDKRVSQKENRPLELQMYFLISKAAKLFSPAETLEFHVDKMKNEMEEKCNSVKNPKVGLLYLHRFFVGVLAEMTKYKEAIQSIQAAIGHQAKENSLDEDSKESYKEALARSYCYLAVLQFRDKDYEASLKSRRCALDITLDMFGEQHSDTADNYHELATIMRTQGDCESALNFYQCALDIRLKLFGENSLKVASSCHELGVTHCKVKEYSTSLELHKRALKIRLETLGEEHRDTASSYHECGVTQWYLEKYDSALDAHHKALKILHDVIGEHPKATADSQHEIGKTYFCVGDHRKALQFHLHAFRTRLKVLGEQHTDTANSCFEIGVTQFEMGWYASALQYHTHALNMRQAMHDDSPHEEVAQSIYQLGRVQCQMGNFEEAINSLKRAFVIRTEDLEQEQDLETAYIFDEIGKAFTLKGDYTLASKMYRIALGIRERKMGDAHASVADSLFQLGLVEWLDGRLKESRQLNRRAAQVRRGISRKKRSASSTFSRRIWFVKCTLVILLILMVVSFNFIVGLSSSEKRYI